MKPQDIRSVSREIREELSEAAAPRPRIVLVEDDDDLRESLSLLLGRRYEVVGAATGRDILGMLDAYEPRLVILDVNLPGRDGFALCRQVRASPRHRHLPVVFLTARPEKEGFIRCLQAEGDAYLTKPVEARELEDTLRRLAGS